MKKSTPFTWFGILLAVSLALVNAWPAFSSSPLLDPAPEIEINPTSFELNLQAGEQSDQSLTIRNTGDANLAYELSITQDSRDAFQAMQFPQEKIEPALQEILQTQSNEQIEYLIYLEEQADLSPAYRIADWSERGWFVYQTLWETAQRTQADLLAELEMHQASGEVSSFHAHFIVNAVLVQGSRALVDEMALRNDIAYIESLGTYTIPETYSAQGDAIHGLAWGVEQIHADQVWSDFDVRGEGIVVASIDTGVAWDHDALRQKYRGYDGYQHDYNWWDPYNWSQPSDSDGHGSHTMGTMLGDDGQGEQIGVAPEAQWIAAMGCPGGTCPIDDLINAGEWVLAPFPIGSSAAEGDPDQRPHIVNNSWGGTGGDTFYEGTVEAWRAAGIFPAFAAGNSGPHWGSIGSPAD